MGLINFFKKDKIMFYSDSLEVFLGIKQSLDDCSNVLSNSSINDYKENFRICGKAFYTVNDIIDRFIDNWITDDEKICSTLSTIKNYLEYYIRLCHTSSDSNYKENSKYMVDSIKTVGIVVNMKISFISNNKLINKV